MLTFLEQRHVTSGVNPSGLGGGRGDSLIKNAIQEETQLQSALLMSMVMWPYTVNSAWYALLYILEKKEKTKHLFAAGAA